MEHLDLKFTLTQNEITSYLRNLYFKAFISKTYIARVIVLILIFLIYLCVQGVTDISYYTNLTISIIVYALLLCGAFILGRKNDSKKMINAEHYLSKEYVLSINRERILSKGRKCEVPYRWSEMHGYSETKLMYIILLSPVECLLVPKSAFKSIDDKIFFEQCLSHIQDNK